MTWSRREFIERTGSASALAILTPAGFAPFTISERSPGVAAFDASLLPSVDQVWEWQVWMDKLGPKYTGNDAHKAFVEFLASNLESTGLEVTRDRYTFPRWTAKRWALGIKPASGAAFEVPVTSYYPYSGQTPARGVTGDLVAIKAATSSGFAGAYETSGDLAGKIAFIEVPLSPAPYAEWYRTVGFATPGTQFPTAISGVWGIFTPLLTNLKSAGAVGVVLGWTNISDEAAADQYIPFSKPLQDIPALWVGRATTARLRNLVGTGAKATLTLEADVARDTPTDTLIATLPGSSSDEVIIVNTHTDGPNATEENGGIGVLALAKYFSKVPKNSRNRTLVFALTTGHFALAYLPSIRGFIEKHPDIIKKAVASVTVEHLGCREWLDDATMHYKATGRDELTLAITEFDATARIMLDSVKGTADRRVAVVKPVPPNGRYFGEGGALSRAGIPNIGYIPIPSYLVAGPPEGLVDRLSKTLMHGQIEGLAKAIHGLDVMSVRELKASGTSTPNQPKG